MIHGPTIPELAQRDRFVRRAVKEWRVLTLKDEEAACVASSRQQGRTVQLFWSSPVEAKRWGKTLAGEDTLQEIALQDFAAEILPGLKSGKGLAGTDWVSDPIEAEVEPADLLIRLKAQAVQTFLAVLLDKGEVFLINGDTGPQVQTVERRRGEAQLVQIFPARSEADRAMRRSNGERITADPLDDFRASTLPWLIERGYLVSLEPIPGAGAIEVTPQDLLARLQSAAAAHEKNQK
jgi:hypothetical protein